MERNSLCQFWNDSNQNWDVPRYCQGESADIRPCAASSALWAAAPEAACRRKEAANSSRKARLKEYLYTVSANPPLLTGQGAPFFDVARRGSSSTSARLPGLFDSAEPFWYRKAVSTMYMPICRNSLSQFSVEASQNSGERK